VTPLLLELSDVSKAYGALRPLRIARLSVAAGESVAILGLDLPAAEMLLNLITGATLPDRGEVRTFGRSTAAIVDSHEWLAHVDRFGIVSERAVLLDGLSVTQNLAIPFTLEVEPPPDEVRERAERLAAEAGVAAAAWPRPVGEVDAATRGRVRFGRALALDPEVLLIEHLSAGLEREAAVSLGAGIRRVAERRGAALIAATADREFARAIAARVLTLDPATGRLSERRNWLRGLRS
jgi:ABC-type transporter Mla maintaining outer membrane lipid asymmetry ATPase subunit MlaF